MPRCRSPTVVGMSRRSAGAAASTPPRTVAARRSAEGRAAGGLGADGRAARRLAATLGPLPDADGGRASGRDSPGLLDTGDLRSFSYGGGTGSGPDQAAADGTAEARLRWRLGIRAAVLLGVVSLLAGGWFWWRIATTGPEVMPLSAVTSDAAGTAPSDAPGTVGSAAAGEGQGGDSAGTVVVHVAGAVKKAGIVELPGNSRVHQAIAAAGGAAPAADLNRLNLASVLEDGQKIHVPSRGEAASPEAAEGGAPSAGGGEGSASSGVTSGGGGPAPGGKVNLNSAGAEELAELPKVGPVLAQRIVDWRKEHGPFKTVEEVDAVDGVGPKMLEALLPLLTI
jgi:competence protein ComEA